MGDVLGNIATKNVYCSGHGSPLSMNDSSGATFICSREIAYTLGNHWYPKNGQSGGVKLGNPYRFVFLDGCDTMSKAWCKAFGIMPLWAIREKVGPQAFVGWDRATTMWLSGYYIDSTTPGEPPSCDLVKSVHAAFAYTRNLAGNLYGQFIAGGVALTDRIQSAATPADGSAPLSVWIYKNNTVTLFGSDIAGPYNFSVPVLWTADMWLAGHPGLTRSGVNESKDKHDQWPAGHP